jgi:2-polyprenyl-3-methyl-5-hydroxy-6-metoxy-1,4-benzoquinol methylase
MSKEVIEFYNSFKDKQIDVGINIRHRTIFKYLKREGLKSHFSVLEIGCGIGSLTKLMSNYIYKGNILAVDISPESIRFAKGYIKKKNVSFVVSDMLDFSSELQFDFIVLPDVLEHIPLENHEIVFQNLAKCCKPSTIVFINMPSPNIQKYMAENEPELLQIIDLEVHSDELLRKVYNCGFYLSSLNTYSLWFRQGDYQRIVLKRKCPVVEMERVSYFPMVWKEIKSRLFF